MTGDLPDPRQGAEGQCDPQQPWTEEARKKRSEHRARDRRVKAGDDGDRRDHREDHSHRLRNERTPKVSVGRMTERRRHAAAGAGKIRRLDPTARRQAELSMRSEPIRIGLEHPGNHQERQRGHRHCERDPPSPRRRRAGHRGTTSLGRPIRDAQRNVGRGIGCHLRRLPILGSPSNAGQTTFRRGSGSEIAVRLGVMRHPDWIDGHLDLAWIDLGLHPLDRPSSKHRAAVSWRSLDRARVGTVFGTIFTEMDGPADDPAAYPSGDAEAAHAAGRRQLDWYLQQEVEGRIRIVRERSNLAPGPRPNVVLLMECADPIRTPQEAEWWVEQGVRIVGLSWGRGSRYAGGNAAPGGLTDPGRSLVRTLDELGVAHDCSHLSREAFDDLLRTTHGPVCATHSNAASLAGDDARHLLDDQYRALAARNAVIGLNLYGRFLNPTGSTTVRDCVAHLEHAAALVGRDRLALGSDADGGFDADALPEELRDLEHLDRLDSALEDAGWTDAERRGFRAGNWSRWLETVPALGPA